MQQCQNQLATICNRPVLPQPISTLIGSQPDHVGQYFCPPGWLTHWLVLDAGICYRRDTMKEAVDTDEAQQVWVRHGGHLAVAPTHNIRIALEQVYAAFNNRSVVDSWIGLRNRGEQPDAFSWVLCHNLNVPKTSLDRDLRNTRALPAVHVLNAFASVLRQVLFDSISCQPIRELNNYHKLSGTQTIDGSFQMKQSRCPAV